MLVEPWTYNYLNSHYTNKVNATNEKTDITGYKGTHTSVVTQEKALAMLDDAADRGGQFYMQVAPGKYKFWLISLSKSAHSIAVAPHQQIGGGSSIPPM